jgi:hypothetical protein
LLLVLLLLRRRLLLLRRLQDVPACCCCGGCRTCRLREKQKKSDRIFAAVPLPAALLVG